MKGSESRVLEYGHKVASNLPFIKSIIEAIFLAIDSIYGKIKSKKHDDKIKAIVKIILDNEDPDAQTAEGLCKTLALAALEITNRKNQMIVIAANKIADRKKNSQDAPDEDDSGKGTLKKVMEFIMQKVN